MSLSAMEAKFEREKKDQPKDWLILPIKRGGLLTGRFQLQYIGSNPNECKTVCRAVQPVIGRG